MTNFEFLRDRLLRQAGLVEPLQLDPRYKLENLRKSEWCPRFEEYMHNRLIMGALRYGLIADPPKGKKYDRVKSMISRLQKYQETGNDEILVDVANLAMMQFVVGEHPNKHFAAFDDGEHCEVKK